MKEPIPKIDLELSDVTDIKSMSKDEIKLVPLDKKKWTCGVKDCLRHTQIKDYGLYPEFYWRGIWVNIRQEFFLCAAHYKYYKSIGKDATKLDLKDIKEIIDNL